MLTHPWLAVAVPLAVALALALYQRRRRRVVRALGDATLAARLFGTDLRRAPRLRFGVLLLAAALLGVAAADPRWGAATESALQQAPDVVLLLDASNSMLTEDVAPSRLARERALAGELLGPLERARVGVVVFAGRAFVLTPPTADQGAVRLYLDALGPGIVTQTGSSLASALHQGVALLAGERGGGALVLMSDGDALEEESAALAEADLARRAGVRVFTVGLGTAGGGAVPDVDETTGRRRGYKHEPTGEVAVSRLNARLLEQIARRSGGEYFANPATAAALGARLRQLPAHPARGGTGAAAEGLAPRYAAFAAAALLLLVADALLARSARRARGVAA